MTDTALFVSEHARRQPDRPAVVEVATGETVTYGALETRSVKLSRMWRERGIGHGGHVAILMDNDARYFEVAWAAQRSGLYFTPVNWHLTPDEAAYIVRDCGATVLVASGRLTGLARAIAARTGLGVRLAVGGAIEGFERYEDAVSGVVPIPLDDEAEGTDMFYSSGTTGRPKGVRRPLPLAPLGSPHPVVSLAVALWGFGPDTRYLSPAPLYHAAPLGISMAVHRVGGTVVLAERFDAQQTLELISSHRITHAQFVPTMFLRLLELPEEVRSSADLRSLRQVIHAAAPCPPDVKAAMIDWLGPIVCEYYSGTEGVGFTHITSEEWLSHRGSVGRPLLGDVHVVDDDGRELAAGETGTVYFSGGPVFSYHNDPEKTAQSYDHRGWATLGDIGHVDEEGYLYITDRREFMVISGGVNLYPRETEDALIGHPTVVDAAAFGIPHPDLGEQLIAVVQLADPAVDPGRMAAELDAWCASRIARYKCPRRIEFVDELPRLPTGKLHKRLLRERYW
jgi:acyl-CoA synthetase (AMP-forming)/AMP-acid ligase II